MTFWPTPVPLTLLPFSSALNSLYSLLLILGGSNSSTPQFSAILYSSACRLSPMAGPRHRFVKGFCQGAKGLRKRFGEGAVSDCGRASVREVGAESGRGFGFAGLSGVDAVKRVEYDWGG